MLKNLVIKLLAFFLIISCQTVYIKLDIFPGDLFVTIVILILLISVIYSSFKKNNYVLNYKKFKLFLIKILIWDILAILPFIYNYFLSSLFANKFNISSNIVIISLLIVIFDLNLLLCSFNFVDILKILKYMVVFMYWLNLSSLFFYFFGQILNIIPHQYVLINWGGMKNIESYLGLFFISQPGTYSYLSYGRNTGVFAEAPMFAFMIIVTLMFDCLILKNKDKKRIFISVITLLTTASTTGIILLICLFIVWAFINNNKRIQFFSFLLSPILLGIGFFIIYKIYTDKLSSGHSASIRKLNLISALDSWILKPFVGYGYKSETFSTLSGHTSVFTQVLQDGGLSFFIYYFSPFFYNLFQSIKIRKWRNIFFIILYLLLLFNTVITYTVFSIFIVSMFLSNGLLNPSNEKNYKKSGFINNG